MAFSVSIANIMTPFIKKKEVKKDWYIINAQNAAVGRLAAFISKVLRGKNKPTFNNKKYYKHTGHPGGIKETTPAIMKEKNKTEQILKLAVKRMLPGGPLAKKQLTKLKIYNGDKHPHEIQKPKIIDFERLNKSNTVK